MGTETGVGSSASMGIIHTSIKYSIGTVHGYALGTVRVQYTGIDMIVQLLRSTQWKPFFTFFGLFILLFPGKWALHDPETIPA